MRHDRLALPLFTEEDLLAVDREIEAARQGGQAARPSLRLVVPMDAEPVCEDAGFVEPNLDLDFDFALDLGSDLERALEASLTDTAESSGAAPEGLSVDPVEEPDWITSYDPEAFGHVAAAGPVQARAARWPEAAVAVTAAALGSAAAWAAGLQSPFAAVPGCVLAALLVPAAARRVHWSAVAASAGWTAAFSVGLFAQGQPAAAVIAGAVAVAAAARLAGRGEGGLG